MKLRMGTLSLIKSKNAPVFHLPSSIAYDNEPQKGEVFKFTFLDRFGGGHLSTTKKVHRFPGFSVVQTLNSYYLIVEEACK